MSLNKNPAILLSKSTKNYSDKIETFGTFGDKDFEEAGLLEIKEICLDNRPTTKELLSHVATTTDDGNKS